MKKITLLMVIAIMMGASVLAVGQKEVQMKDRITGIPVVYGSEPHTYVCIETEAGKIYYVHPDNQKEIRKLDRFMFFFTIEFIKGDPVSLDATFHPDGTVRVISWKKKN